MTAPLPSNKRDSFSYYFQHQRVSVPEINIILGRLIREFRGRESRAIASLRPPPFPR